MSKALFEEISATGAYIASLKGSRILDSAVKDRYEALKALVAQTPLTASAAAMAVNAVREIDWPLATTDKLIACVHDRMISPSSRVGDATGWKYQDFTNMPNFLTGSMWASRDILEPLCMLAAKMTLQTMNEDTAAVLAALVMAQQLGLEEAANASPQSQYDMVQLVKKKVKVYSGKSLQSNMQVLPASADMLLLHDAEIYHSAFPVDGPVSMPLDKFCFEKLVGLIPRRKSSIRLRGSSLLQQHVPQLQQQMPQMPMNMNMENIGALFKMFTSMSNRDDNRDENRDDPRFTILRDANNRGQNHLLDRPASAGSQHVDDPRGFVLDGPAGAIHGGQPGGNRLPLDDQPAGHPDSPKVPKVVLPQKRKSIADATTELLAAIGKKKTKKVASSEQAESDDDASDASSEPASAKKKKTKNQKVANGGKAKGGKAKGGKAKDGKAKAGNAKTYKMSNEPTRNQCRIRCSDSTSFSIPYRDHGNSERRTVAAAKKWMAQH
jgi:hypothetical protein